MSTRSIIARLHTDGSVEASYCHFDGYPEGVGKTLKEHYSLNASVADLLELGDLSSLGDNLQETVAYARDRGEEKSDNLRYDNLSELLSNVRKDTGAEYAYVWDGTIWATYTLKDRARL